jgi:hypothetical protein
MIKLRKKTIFLLISSLMILSLLACSSEATPESPDIEATVQARVKTALDSMPTPTPKVVFVTKEVSVEKIVEVIKEVEVEVPVEKIVEVIKEVAVEVPVEKIVEVIKEVIKEVIVEKIVEVVVTATPTPTSTPMPRFGPGIYYRQPFLDSPGALLMNLDNILLARINVQAFDIRTEAVVYAVEDKLALVAPDGNLTLINVPGLHQMDRPSFSPDGTKVAIQARETYTEPEDLNIYIVDLNTGESERISYRDFNEESPEWFANENKIAYSSFDPQSGVSAHVYDIDLGKEILTIKDAGYIHLAVSPDGDLIFNPILAHLYDANTGALVADLKDKILNALHEQGYTPDSKFHAQADIEADLGSFPMDADFSPDGTEIVLDGAVRKDGEFGFIIFTMTTTGDNITRLTDIIEVNPAFSNNNNYSQLNPNWR